MTEAAPRYEHDARPGHGEIQDVLPGLKWLRMPLPMVLEHINLWLPWSDDEWCIVDTGIQYPDTQAFWEHVIEQEFAGRPAAKVVLTHMHPDHAGMAGELCRRFDSPLYMTAREYLTCRLLAADTGTPAPAEGIAFYRAAGLDEQAIERYVKNFGLFGSVISPLPLSYRRLRDGDMLELGPYRFEVIIGTGHSPEHACLFCADENFIISGDQILPTISSNVSVWPTEPLANPLDDWLVSCRRLRDRLPADVLVFPAHGRPFRGAAVRLQALIDEHEEGLAALLELCREPRRAVDVFPALFKSRITAGNLIMATGEALAHLHCLEARGELLCEQDEHGVRWFRRTW